MANCKIARLSKKEVRFIKLATLLADGVFDFENHTAAQFRKEYGLQKADANNMVEVLRSKMDHLLSQFEKESIVH